MSVEDLIFVIAAVVVVGAVLAWFLLGVHIPRRFRTSRPNGMDLRSTTAMSAGLRVPAPKLTAWQVAVNRSRAQALSSATAMCECEGVRGTIDDP